VAKILVVDDEKLVLEVMQSRFEIKGYEVETCSYSEEALEKVLTGSFDLVLVDYNMPVLKGDDICQTIRSDSRLKDLPVIIMTAYVQHERQFFIERGATDVIYKPFGIEELMKMIQQYLDWP
jgi:CheY-like chemotaxis protein